MNNSLKAYAKKRVYHKESSYIYKRKYDDIYRIVKINNNKNQINMTKLNKVTIEVKKENQPVKVDKRKFNTGRPINKKSARYKRLAKQAFYNDVNNKFVSGKAFTLKGNQQAEYHYSRNADNTKYGSLFNGIGNYVCTINYIGRTKVQGFTYVLNKRVNVEVNLKEVQFVK